MKRYALLASIAAIGGTMAYQGSVSLQATTPGSPQNGHSNISGTSKAGFFLGNGSLLTNLNASALNTGIITLTGTSPTYIIRGSNASSASSASGVIGIATSTTGATYGGWFEAKSTSGRALFGYASSTTGATYGTYAQNNSDAGRASFGLATSLTGVTYGGFFSSQSVDGRGVYGQATAGTGTTYGVYGKAISPTGFGVFSEGNLGVTGVIGGNGAGITNMNASALATGTIGDSLLSANVAMRNAPNDFVGNNTFTNNGIGAVVQVTGSGFSSPGILSNVSGSNSIGLSGIGSGSGSTGVRGNGETGGTFLGITGVYGQGNYGVSGNSNSPSGTGVSGTAMSSGVTYGGSFFADSPTGFGVKGENLGAGGTGIFGTASGQDSNGVLGVASGFSSAAVRAVNSSPDGYGVVAANEFGLALLAIGKSLFDGNVSVGGRHNPIFPIDFADTLGDKISLWGSSPSSHYGMGIQGSQFQLFTATPTDYFSLGSGGSGSFAEVFRLSPASAHLQFRPTGVDSASQMTTPYDFLFDHDRDNDNTDSWIRIYTNANSIEQMRVEDGDEAPARFDGTVNANGIDFAEGFKIFDTSLQPGELVINSGSNWQFVTRSSVPYQTGVIGVVSTKPAFVAGMSFNAEDEIDPELTRDRNSALLRGDVKLAKELTKQMAAKVKEAYRPIAMMGRVPVRVTGAVRPGDHLTASAIPGCAMAMTQPGHSIGIALETSSGGLRSIMVMIQPGYFGGAVSAAGTNSGGLKALKSEVDELRAENRELRDRLDRLERLVLANKR
ncbi:MAG: bZIP transcription factor [Fimbriimonadaceae bacterium]